MTKPIRILKGLRNQNLFWSMLVSKVQGENPKMAHRECAAHAAQIYDYFMTPEGEQSLRDKWDTIPGCHVMEVVSCVWNKHKAGPEPSTAEAVRLAANLPTGMAAKLLGAHMAENDIPMVVDTSIFDPTKNINHVYGKLGQRNYVAHIGPTPRNKIHLVRMGGFWISRQNDCTTHHAGATAANAWCMDLNSKVWLQTFGRLRARVQRVHAKFYSRVQPNEQTIRS